MRPRDVTEQAPGELRPCVEGYFTYIPHQLPPALQFGNALVHQISRSERALGELHALSGLVPNAMLLIQPFMAREAVLSSRIEGTVTQLDELLQAQEEPKTKVQTNEQDLREVQNYIRSLYLGIELLESIPLSLRLIRKVHETLMEGVRGQEKNPGKFRQCSVMIGRKGQSFDQARFVPPYYTELEPLLKNLEAFFHEEQNLPAVVMAALIHYQFEAIHPFVDGNGRVGRLLISLFFHARGSLAKPLLYLSAFFEEQDEEYRDHLLTVSQKGTWGEWIEFFARGVEEQSQDAICRARNLLDLQTTYRKQLIRSSQSSVVLHLIDELFSSPFISIGGAARKLGVTPRAAKQNIEKLLKAEILEEVPLTGRKLLYRAPEILRILNLRKASDISIRQTS